MDVSNDAHAVHPDRADHISNLGAFPGHAKMCVRLVPKGRLL
jgi:hypothetical protein